MENQNNSDNFGGIPADSLINELNELGAGRALGTGSGCSDCGRADCTSDTLRRVSEAVSGAGSFEGACSVLRSFSLDDRRVYLAHAVMSLTELMGNSLIGRAGSDDRDAIAGVAAIMCVELLRGKSCRPPSERMGVAGDVLREFVDLPTAGDC